MRFKLDENLPRELADDLMRLGHHTDTVQGEGLAGAEDKVIVQAALRSGRVLMTLDKGIASLFQFPAKSTAAWCCSALTHRGGNQSYPS